MLRDFEPLFYQESFIKLGSVCLGPWSGTTRTLQYGLGGEESMPMQLLSKLSIDEFALHSAGLIGILTSRNPSHNSREGATFTREVFCRSLQVSALKLQAGRCCFRGFIETRTTAAVVLRGV